MDFADILRKSFRKSDIIARIGGDEFVVLCLESSESSIERLLSRLYKNIEIYNSTMNKPYKLSISAGFSFYNPKDPITLDELLHIADQRMYKEKMGKKR
jgi:diguanylate cyclase (GGDEF)-like protein